MQAAKGGKERYSYLAVRPGSHHNEQCGKLVLDVQQWHFYPDGNRQLFNWIYHPLHRREVMPGNGHLDDFLEMVRLWVLEENLQPTRLQAFF